MEVLKSGDVPALVTNIEVLNLLSKRIQRRQQTDDEKKKDHPKLRHRNFIEEKVFEYLQTTPCANVDIDQMPSLITALIGGEKNSSDSKSHSDEEKAQVENVDRAEKGYNLIDAEILQVLNLMPTEKVEAHLMIEQLENRMDDDRQDQMLQLISEYSGKNDSIIEGEEEEIVEEEL